MSTSVASILHIESDGLVTAPLFVEETLAAMWLALLLHHLLHLLLVHVLLIEKEGKLLGLDLPLSHVHGIELHRLRAGHLRA